MCFLSPNKQTESKIVYVDNLSTEGLVEETKVLKEIAFDSETDTESEIITTDSDCLVEEPTH